MSLVVLFFPRPFLLSVLVSIIAIVERLYLTECTKSYPTAGQILHLNPTIH